MEGKLDAWFSGLNVRRYLLIWKDQSGVLYFVQQTLLLYSLSTVIVISGALLLPRVRRTTFHPEKSGANHVTQVFFPPV